MRLYYYTSAKNGYDDFDQEHIKISQVGLVNDPNEWLPRFANREVSGFVPHAFARQYIANHWGTRHGFVSLSKSWNIAPMWGNYADKYRGVVLEVSVLREDCIFPVTYQRERPICEPIANESEFRKIFGTKSMDWHYEQEVRYLHSLDADNCQWVGTVGFGPLQVISPSCAGHIRLERIICGPCIGQEDLDMLVSTSWEYERRGRLIPIALTGFDVNTYQLIERGDACMWRSQMKRKGEE